MQRLDLLLKTMATAFDVSEASVRSRWVLLRKAGLWSKVGPGRDMPNPKPSDVTNLLLSFLAGGLATETAATVGLVRQSRGNHPPVTGMEELQDDSLGVMLEALFARLAADGRLLVTQDAAKIDHSDQDHLDLEARRRIDYCELSMRRTWLGWQTEFGVGTRPDRSEFRGVYKRVLPRHIGLVSEMDPQRILKRLEARKGGYPDRVTIEIVSQSTLASLGACLRGDSAESHRHLSEVTRVLKQTETWVGGRFVAIKPPPGTLILDRVHVGRRTSALQETPQRRSAPRRLRK